jgi:hypothetical protein
MKIDIRPIAEIKPYPNNPRINDDAVDAVASSIKEFGFRQPIVVDTDGVIICGHTRFKAAQKLGLEKVPIHVATDLTPEQIKAYRIADNKSSELADWNFDLLPIELGDLQTNGFDLSLLGFDSDELLKLLKTDIEEGLTDPDDVPAPPDAAVTQPGDLWILGNHRLLCGDSSKPEDLDRLLGGKTIQLVNTDPPYNVKVEPRSNNAIAAGLSSFSNDCASQKLKGGQTSQLSPGDQCHDRLDGGKSLIENQSSMFWVAIVVQVGCLEAPVTLCVCDRCSCCHGCDSLRVGVVGTNDLNHIVGQGEHQVPAVVPIDLDLRPTMVRMDRANSAERSGSNRIGILGHLDQSDSISDFGCIDHRCGSFRLPDLLE